MGEDISNKTLAVLVGLAIIVSLAGIMFAPKGTITGRFTDDGTATLNALGTASITVTDTAINFLTGAVSGSGDCVIDSMNTSNKSEANSFCGNGLLGTSTGGNEPDTFIINNSGTGNFSLATYGDGNADVFSMSVTGQTVLEIRLVDSGTTGSDTTCGDQTTGATTYATITSIGVGDTHIDLCDEIATAEFAEVALQVTIDSGQTTGTEGSKTETITFVGTII